MRFLIDNNTVDDLQPVGMIGGFEARHVGPGAMFTYGLGVDWALESSHYEFCITEIPRRTDTDLLVACVGIMAAFARCVAEKYFIDYHGVWCGGDIVEVEDIFAMRVNEKFPLDVALWWFYSIVPGLSEA